MQFWIYFHVFVDCQQYVVWFYIMNQIQLINRVTGFCNCDVKYWLKKKSQQYDTDCCIWFKKKKKMWYHQLEYFIYRHTVQTTWDWVLVQHLGMAVMPLFVHIVWISFSYWQRVILIHFVTRHCQVIVVYKFSNSCLLTTGKSVIIINPAIHEEAYVLTKARPLHLKHINLDLGWL